MATRLISNLMCDTRGGIEMTEIRVGENESIDSAIKRFKRQCARSGVLTEYRKSILLEHRILRIVF